MTDLTDLSQGPTPKSGVPDAGGEPSGTGGKKRTAGRLAGADFITAVLLIVFGAVFFAGAAGMRVYRTILVSPGFFPMILGILFIVFGLVLMYSSSRRRGRADARRILSGGNLKRGFTSPVFKKGGIVFLLILGYVALLGKISFVYLSMAYLFLTFFFLKAAKWYWILIISAVAPIIVQIVFSHVFRIPMP
ncbi:MAG: tripartite tricarboxylate transporter TctB family protein [Synergistaceae bacterium]|nr:tripartite tricarboxylate transporter TctB family protein [Synergistaceae bacterium]